MTTTNSLRKLLHRKAWELCTPSPNVTTAGSFITGNNSGALPANDAVYYVYSASVIYNYSPDQDAWLQIPASGIAGAFAAGACGEFRSIGVPGGSLDQSATGGTTSSITTSRTIVRDLVGCEVRVISGAGAGYEGVVSSTRVGANAVLNLTPVNGVAFDATTVFRVWSGSLWFFNAGTSAVGFSVYDRATNAWTAKSVTNLPTAWGTCGQLISTGSIEGPFETGQSTGTNTATTLNNTAKNWQANAYANAQVRITAGTGAGQIRTIASNTVTALTVSSAWTTTPDATSQYSIEGNDDYLYLLGNNAVTLYRYSISGNAWSTLTPGTARGGSMGAGGTADWINGVPAWATPVTAADGSFVTGTTLFRQNGRYIYSLRGAGSSVLDIYDIAANAWINGAAYGNQLETFTTGSCSADYAGYIYLMKESTGRFFRFDIAKHALEPWSTNVYPVSTATEGDKMTVIVYRDGGTAIPFVYCQQQSRQEFLREMVIG